MENMDKGLTVPKRVLIVWPQIPQMPQNLSAPFVCPSPKVIDFNKKKASMDVRSPCRSACPWFKWFLELWNYLKIVLNPWIFWWNTKQQGAVAKLLNWMSWNIFQDYWCTWIKCIFLVQCSRLLVVTMTWTLIFHFWEPWEKSASFILVLFNRVVTDSYYFFL